MKAEIRQSLIEAERLKEQGRHKEAISICEKVIAEDIDNFIAFEEIADNFISLNQVNKAKKALYHSLKINPDSANANYLLGFVFSYEQKWQKSIAYLQRAEKKEKHNPEVLRCLGWSLFNYGCQEEGIILLERVKSMSPRDSFVLCDLGICYMMREKYAKALDLFTNAARIDPENKKVKDCIKIARMFGNKVIV